MENSPALAPMHLLRVWGRDIDVVKALRTPDIFGDASDNGVANYWFATESARDDLEQAITNSGALVVTSITDNEHTRKLTWAKVVLLVGKRKYSFTECFGFGYEPEDVEFLFRDGNYACDCNRSLFIARQCDNSFKVRDCGHRIVLASLEISLVDPRMDS